MSSLKVNDTFTSYEALRKALSRFEDENRVQFWKRDAKKIEYTKQYAPHIYEIAKNYPELEYYYLKFSCIHGGQVFRPYTTKTGTYRRNRGTWKQDCKAEISVSLTKDRRALIINNILNKHNHKIPSVEEYKQLPKQRKKLMEEKIKKRQQLKKMEEKRTCSHAYTTKSVLEKIVKTNSSSRSNNFKKLANLLMEKYHCEIFLQVDEEDKVFGFFFQDQYMKTSFGCFPEVLYIDGTYKLQNIDCRIYILYTENSFGNMDVVGVAVLTVDDRNSLQWLLEKFKETSPEWSQIKVVVTDKFTGEYRLIQKEFSDACALICQTHAFQVFQKEIKSPKLDLTQSERKDSLQYIKKLIHAENEEEYKRILDEMVEQVPYSFLEYFYKTWHETRSEWSTAFTRNFRKYINNKLESPNSKLKSVIHSCKNFNEFIEKLFVFLDMKRMDFKSEFTRMTYKVPKLEKDEYQWGKYHKYLTHFAFTKIEPFLKSTKQYSLIQEGPKMICETQKKKLVLTETSCSCFFFMEINLPCKHVLFYRKSIDMELFDDDLFSERWSKRYIRSGFGKLLSSKTAKNESEENEQKSEEQINEIYDVCTGLAKLCAEANGKEFLSKLNFLLNLKRCWENGEKVSLDSDEETHFKIVEDSDIELVYDDDDNYT